MVGGGGGVREVTTHLPQLVGGEASNALVGPLAETGDDGAPRWHVDASSKSLGGSHNLQRRGTSSYNTYIYDIVYDELGGSHNLQR